MENQSFWQHILQNVSLICLSIIFLPLDTFIVVLCLLYRPFGPYRKPHTPKPKTILVSSLTMTKGLFLARAFYLAGHKVIGLDFKQCCIPSSGGYSIAVSKHREIQTPSNDEEYAEELKRIIKDEEIDLWVCVSGVATTMKDANAKRKIESETCCKVFQLKPETCEILDDKHRFIEKTKEIKLMAPKTKLVKSHDEALAFLCEKPPKQYILKSIRLDDTSRADMTRYPRETMQETTDIISRFQITDDRPWIFQEFVDGKEYCTHAVVVRGRVKAFVVCPSSGLLLHYRGLPADSNHSKKILEFTEKYASGLEEKNPTCKRKPSGPEDRKITGQLSFDFIVKETDGKLQLYPIECNPRTHTAVVLFGTDAKRLAGCYLSLLDDPEAPPSDVYIPDSTVGFYWIGHDIVTLLFLPLLYISDFSSLYSNLKELIEHVLYWKDATFEVWDPVPFWLLYHVYWPGLFLRSIVKWEKWSRINVSTTKMFKCS